MEHAPGAWHNLKARASALYKTVRYAWFMPFYILFCAGFGTSLDLDTCFPHAACLAKQ